MAEPLVEIIRIDKTKVSDENGFKNSYLTFTFNEDVKAYSVRCLGTSYNTGKFVEWGDKYVSTQSNLSVSEASNTSILNFASFPRGSEITAEINYLELYQEGENQINIYGSDLNDIWSNYRQG